MVNDKQTYVVVTLEPEHAALVRDLVQNAVWTKADRRWRAVLKDIDFALRRFAIKADAAEE